MKFFQIGLLLFLMSAFGLFAYQEYASEIYNLPESKETVQNEIAIDPPKKKFAPISNLDSDVRWNLNITTSSQSFEGFDENYCSDSLNILCFRGSNFRNSPTRGNIAKAPIKVELDWIFKTRKDTNKTEFGSWDGGTGWTGQPLIIRWPKKMRNQLNIIDPEFIQNENALEVVIGSLCGDVYFLNFETGDSTRSSIKLDGPIKGTPSIDPRLNGLLYVGQGIDLGKRFGSYIIDMKTSNIVFHQPGRDKEAFRQWGAFDSNPLIDRNSGNIFWPSENGIFYTFNSFNPEQVKLISKLKYKNKNVPRQGMEASMAAVGKYGFIADNSGNIFCMDLKTQTFIWNQDNLDDTDASLVIDREKEGYYLYAGNEVDHRGPSAISSFRKLNALNGKEEWSVSRTCFGTPIADKTNSGGILATPLIGKNKAQNLAYCLFSRSDEQNRSELVCVDKTTGKEKFSFKLKAYSWASPIDIYDKLGNMYLFFTDVKGTIYLINGLSGELIYTEKTGYTFESSPIAINNRIVVGVRGNKILSFLMR